MEVLNAHLLLAMPPARKSSSESSRSEEGERKVSKRQTFEFSFCHHYEGEIDVNKSPVICKKKKKKKGERNVLQRRY